MTTDRILELFAEIDSTPFGPAERALVDEAVALAMTEGAEELEYKARMRLTASAKQTGDTDTMLSSFAWCLAKHDSDPTRFPADLDNGGADLLWQYKWMAGTLGASPIFPRADIDAVLTDMREHYQRAGLGMSGVLTAEFEDAWSNGRLAEAERLHAAIATTPRDDHSHCDACGRSQSSGFLAELGREAEALVLVEEMIEGGFSCGDEPEHALSRALIPYLRTGRLEEAKAAHLRSYRLSRDNPDKISIVANHLIFCAITGNEARGLALLERHIGWLAHDGLNVSAHFSTLLAYGVLLDAIVASGHGELPVRGADAPDLVSFFGAHDGSWSVEQLASAAWAGAAGIGQAFDRRNGNDYHARQLDRAWSLATERYEVPISTDTFLPSPVALADPTDAAGWLTRALELAALGDADRGVDAARHAIDGTHGDDLASAYSRLLGGLVRLERWDEAEAALAGRIAAVRATGQQEQADLEQRRGLAMFGRGTAPDRAGLEEELAGASGQPTAVAADIELSLAAMLMQLEQIDAERISGLLRDAVTHFEGAPGLLSALNFQAHFEAMSGDADVARGAVDRLIAHETNRGALATAHMLRARLRGGAGDYRGGAQDADEATRLFTALDVRGGAVDASSLAGALYGDAELGDEAISRLRYGIRLAELLEASTIGLRFAFGRALVRGDQAGEATEVLSQVFDEETEDGVPPESRAETLYWLGQAFAGNDQPGNAVGAWRSATELYLEGDDTQGAAKSGMAAGRLLGQFGELDDARELLEAAASGARKSPENLGLLTEVLHAYGTAQANSGDASGLDTLDEVIAIARDNGAAWLLADVTDSRARALNALGRRDEAVREALGAADLYLEAGDASSAGGSELLVGRMLAENDRHDDAVAVLGGALEHAENNPRLKSIVALELGDVLEHLGRLAEAEQVRALAD